MKHFQSARHKPRSWYQTHTHADDRGLEHKMFQSLLSEAVNLPDRHLAWRAPAQTPRRPQARTWWKTSTEAQSGLNRFTTPEYRGHWKLQKWPASSQSPVFVTVGAVACCHHLGSPLPLWYFAFLDPCKQLGYSLQSSHWKDGHLSKQKIGCGLLALLNYLNLRSAVKTLSRFYLIFIRLYLLEQLIKVTLHWLEALKVMIYHWLRQYGHWWLIHVNIPPNGHLQWPCTPMWITRVESCCVFFWLP